MQENDEDLDIEPVPTPFSFKLVLFLGVLYLGWRLFQLVDYMIRWAFS